MQEQLTHCREGDMCVEEIVELMKDHHKRETILPRHMCDTKFTRVSVMDKERFQGWLSDRENRLRSISDL